MVRTPCFHCSGHWFNSWLGKGDPAACSAAQPEKKEHGSLHKNYMIGEGNVVRGLCSYLEQNSIGEAEWGESYRAARGSGELWSNSGLEWELSSVPQREEEKNEEAHVLLEYFLDTAHNSSAYIIGQNLVTWPHPAAEKVHKCKYIIYSG